MNILAIDTSCDETAAAVTVNTEISSSVVWSQANLHSSFGGVMPSLAQRQHIERIDYVINKALGKKYKNLTDIDAIAVTIGPGLAVALGVGINTAKKLATEHNLPLIPINHVEGHILSSFAKPFGTIKDIEVSYPALGLVLSGGTTQLLKINGIGNYEIIAETVDDALGEALDKGARLLGFGYPGGAILEKIARSGEKNNYSLPLPLQNDHVKNRFSYSGLKTAFVRLFESIKDLDKKTISDLASTFQSKAFDHVTSVLEYQIKNSNIIYKDLLFGGGVANNIEIKKRLRKICKKNNLNFLVPYNKKLNGDNAGMIGVAAYLKYKNDNLDKFYKYDEVDRNPRYKVV